MLIPVTAFLPGEYRIKHVSAEWERRGCAELRRQVFCEEQGIFQNADTDDIDAIAQPIAAISCVGGLCENVVGTVRIHQPDSASHPDVWWGSRLAVRPEYRSCAWLGSELIRHAVSTAHARKCSRFLAHVQVRNVRLFEHLHWTSLEAVDIQGRRHILMQADLDFYPPRESDELQFIARPRMAA